MMKPNALLILLGLSSLILAQPKRSFSKLTEKGTQFAKKNSGWSAGERLLTPLESQCLLVEPLLQLPLLIEESSYQAEQTAGREYEELDSRLLSEYVANPPQQFLIDPQKLLSDEHKKQILSELENLHQDIGYKCFVFIYRANQVMPHYGARDQLFERLFDLDQKTMWIEYYVGNLDRTELHFSPNTDASMLALERQRALLSTLDEARTKPQPNDQILTIVHQLPMRLNWIKATSIEDEVSGTWSTSLRDDKSSAKAKKFSKKQKIEAFFTSILPILWTIAGIAILTVLLLVWRFWLHRNKHYRFPLLEQLPRLGGIQGASSNLTIAFMNPRQSPQAQKKALRQNLSHF